MEIPEQIQEIAAIISANWENVHYSAVPYLKAMHTLSSITDYYGCDSARSVIRYFLGNARTWRGEIAKAVKAKLNTMVNS
jgi:hypothetical protein